MNMLEFVRLTIAVMYGLIMAADTFFELTGRYARVGVRMISLPGLESKRAANACAWAVLHFMLLLWILDDGWHGWIYAPYAPMFLLIVLALKRMRRALRE